MLARSQPCSATTRQATRAISSRRCAWSTILGMRRWYRQSRGLGSCAVVGLEAYVRGGRPLPVPVKIDRAAGEQVDAGGDRQADQHGDIGGAEAPRGGDGGPPGG